MTGYSEKNRENDLRKYFWKKEKDTRIKISPWVSANQLLNNWAQELNVRQWIVVGFSDSDFFKMNCQKQIYIPYSKTYSNPFNARVNDKNLVRSIFTEYKIP